jgi:hypothetical protein
MSSKPNRPDDKGAPQAGWAPLVLPGLRGLQALYRFDYSDDRQALVLSIRLESSRSIFRYGMTRRDLGSVWDDDALAKRRLKAYAEGEFRKDLSLVQKNKGPSSILQIVWIDSKGRAIR